MDAGALTSEALQSARAEPGVYQLFLDDTLVYVGKSDGSLQGRLDRHRKALTGRQNVTIDSITFKAIHIHPNWSALTTEAALIRHYGRTAWNSSGFGSNDPGRRRDDTAVPDSSFDGMYPIDPGFRTAIPSGTYSAGELLSRIKSELPYLLRYEQAAVGEVDVAVPSDDMPAGALVALIASNLEGDWQATALPGRLLLYRERRDYRHGERLWP